MLTYFHGDIANNICLKQECDVLEIVGCKKEYLIKRIFVNENTSFRDVPKIMKQMKGKSEQWKIE